MKRSWMLLVAAALIWAAFHAAPTPDVEPKPDPVPVVVEPLIPGDGPRLLIVTESDDWRGMPASQVSIKTSGLIDDWLAANGGQKRVWDQHQDVEAADASWRKGMAACADTLPRIVVSNGKNGGYCGPLPQTVADVLKLLEEHAK